MIYYTVENDTSRGVFLKFYCRINILIQIRI